MKKALITGICGFTGSHLTEHLAGLGIEIIGLDLPLEKHAGPDHLKYVSKMYYADIKDRDSIVEIVHAIKPHYVFHLIGLTGDKDLSTLLEINVLGTKNILDAVRKVDTKILIPGSAAEYGAVPQDRLPIHETAPLNPVNNYGISKVAQTLLGYQYFFNYQCQVHIARTFNIIGPREPDHFVCSAIAQQIVKNERKKGEAEQVIHVGNLDTKRDFIDVRDVAAAYWAIVDKGNPGEVYNVCSGKARSVRDILSCFEQLLGVTFTVKQDPSRVRRVDIPINFGSNKKIKDCLGWSPHVDLSKTLSDLLEFYRKRANPTEKT